MPSIAPPMPTRTGRRRLTAVLVLFAGLWAWLLATAPAAHAHAELTETTPANGGQLDTAPEEIVLRFTEGVSAVDGENEVLNADGGAVHDGDAETSDDGRLLHIRLRDDIADGVYTVSWRVISGDSHPINGAFVFSVGDEVVAPLTGPIAETGSEGAVGALFWVFRWGGYAGLALLLGGGYFLTVCWPGGRGDERARRLVRAGLVTSVVSAVGSLLMQGPYSVGDSLARTLDPAVISETVTSDYGLAIGLRLVLLALAVPALRWLFAAASTPVLSRGRLAGLAGLGLAMPLTWGLAGHASAGDLPWLALSTDAVHLLAMSAWVGGLTILITCVLPNDRLPRDEAVAAVPRFSMTAMVAVGALVTTGSFQAWREVRSVDALSGTDYGKLLIFKLAAFGVLLSLGAMSRSVVQKRYVAPQVDVVDATSAGADTGQSAKKAAQRTRALRRAEREREESEREALGQLRQSVRIEVGIAVGVLALTAALVSTPPGEAADGFEAAPVSQNDPAGQGPQGTPFATTVELPDGTGRLDVRLAPAAQSDNELTVTALRPDGTALDLVSLGGSLTLPERDLGPLPVELTEQGTGAGQWNAANVTLPSAGTWQLDLDVRFSEFSEETVTIEVPVS